MKRHLPLSIAAAIACAGIAAASISPDAGFRDASHDMLAYAPVSEAQLPPQAFAVNAMMEDPGAQALDAPFCGSHASVTRGLSENFGETRQNTAEAADGRVVEVWASTEFGTWTVIDIQADSLACVASSGIGWTDASVAAKPLQLAGLL